MSDQAVRPGHGGAGSRIYLDAQTLERLDSMLAIDPMNEQGQAYSRGTFLAALVYERWIETPRAGLPPRTTEGP